MGGYHREGSSVGREDSERSREKIKRGLWRNPELCRI
jgi:hypothetical protein